MNRRISIKTALMLPFMIFIAIVMMLLVSVLQRDYNWLAKEQGAKMASAVNQSTEEKLNDLLQEPDRLNRVFASEIKVMDLGNQKDLSQLEVLALSYMKTVQNLTPQVSVISFGDEKGRFVGVRANGEDDFSLMLKDERTLGMLNIYENETINSNVVGAYEGYDVLTRPWYAPVKKQPKPQWSDIYVNADEKMEITISSLVPVFNKTGAFIGVADTDVKLNGINAFLKANPTKGTGVIFIVDKDWNLIAQSGIEPVMNLVKDDKGNSAVEFIKAFDYDSEMIRTTAQYLKDHSGVGKEVQQVDAVSDKLYVQMSEVSALSQLGWKVITVIPENDLMGTVKNHQNMSLMVIVLMASVVGLIGALVVSKVVQPIKQSAEAAVGISHGDFEHELVHSFLPISEVDELMEAFKDMSMSLKDSFEKIQISEEKYRTLVENIDDMIYSVTPNYKFIAINQRFEKEIDLERKAIIGKGIEAVFTDPAELKFWKEQVDRVVATKEKYTFQYAKVLKDEKRHVYNVNLIPMINLLGRVDMILGSNSDITELVEAQEEIQELHEMEKAKLEKMVDARTTELKFAMDELIEKEKMASLGGLVSGIAHEINTPLGVSVSAASYLKSIYDQLVVQMQNGTMTKSQLIEFLRNLEETANILNTNLYRAAELVKSFKEISVNQITEDLSYFNFKEYVDMILLSLKHEYKNSGHLITVNCNENLVVKSYPGVYAQIFTNLVMNALIHGLKDTEAGEIQIDVQKEEGHLIVQFFDNGLGIPSEALPKIFEPFYTTNRGKGGSGLGLNVVYNLVTGKLNGKITCSSKLGEGTRFTMRVPLIEE